MAFTLLTYLHCTFNTIHVQYDSFTFLHTDYLIDGLHDSEWTRALSSTSFVLHRANLIIDSACSWLFSA